MAIPKIMKVIQQLVDEGYVFTYGPLLSNIAVGYTLNLRKHIGPEGRLAQATRTVTYSSLKVIGSRYEKYLIYELEQMKKELENLERVSWEKSKGE